jgi:DNA repair protein RecN (Recombination protein N)
MTAARLQVDLQAVSDDSPQPHGLELVEFLISTNPGQPAKPLARIASGGELSRISLAIQVITAMTSDTPCMVFDEVDVGIGGGVARTVGKLLKQLGTRSQVLCVTHQALVASLADNHLLVTKESVGNRSHTQIKTLDESDRLEEIARMLGGEADGSGLSAESLAHARELATSN